MTFGEFLSDRLQRLLLQSLMAVAVALILLATGTQPGVILLLLVIVSLVFGAVQVWDFVRQRTRLEEMERILEGLDKKYLFAECTSQARTFYERRLLDFSRRAGRSMIGAVSDAQAAQREYREYVESWVHEIKTPITAAALICRSLDTGTRRKLSQELAQIEAHVERALFYARAESPEKDFLIQQADLGAITGGAIAHHKTLLIQRNVRVEIKNLEKTVYTDKKWADFILGQLLQNAARYQKDDKDSVVTISARELGRQVQLIVCDNGIGIPSHELARVFDRGFTGSNGRAIGGSTGMGLYLCRKLAEHLEIDLQIISQEGKGTTVTLTFPAKGNLTKM